jgi:hypothetical protein
MAKDPTPEMYRFALAAQETMSGIPTDEAERAVDFRKMLTTVLGKDNIQAVGYDGKTTDGTLYAHRKMVLNLEMKLLNDPTWQNCAYAIGLSNISYDNKNQALSNLAYLEVEPQLPCLLLDIHAGTILVVKGAYFAPPSLVVSTLATASMVADDVNGPSHVHLARVLTALKAAVDSLYVSYGHAELAHNSSAVMPDVTHVAQVIRPVNFGNKRAVATEQLMDDRLAFKARLLPGSVEDDWPKEFVLKFARGRYGIEPHRAAAEAGYAPRFLGSTDLPGGFVCVAMELVDGLAWAKCIQSSRDDIAAAVQKAYTVAFEENGNVHGDLRQGNILIQTDGAGEVSGVTFLDFDWAGKAGTARYPMSINIKEWEKRGFKGEMAGSLISPEHDKSMIGTPCVSLLGKHRRAEDALSDEDKEKE